MSIGSGPIADIARSLRDLRIDAGRPSYRELATRANYSPSALSEAARGRRLPSLEVTLAYVAACNGDAEAWSRRWHECAAQLAALEQSATPQPRSAWNGVPVPVRPPRREPRTMLAALAAVGVLSCINLVMTARVLRRSG